MQIEVDQSGKIGDTKVPTVLAFSNEDSHSILIPATVKRECLGFLRVHYRKLNQIMKSVAKSLRLYLGKKEDRGIPAGYGTTTSSAHGVATVRSLVTRSLKLFIV